MKLFARSKRVRILSVSAALVVLLPLAVAVVPRFRWRAQVLLLHVSGNIPDIELHQVVAYMMPGSQQSIERLIETRNPYAVLRNFKTTVADIQAGGRLFRNQCAVCHAQDGGGGPGGPALVGRKFKKGESDWAVYQTVRYGIPNSTMTPHPVPDNEMWQLIAFLRSLDTSGKTGQTDASSAAASPRINVPYAELAPLREASEDWLTYSGSYSSWRHSALTEIDRHNVGQLALRWIHHFEGEPGEIQVSPIVRNGMMFVTVPPNRVMGLNAASGKPFWIYEHKLQRGTKGGEFGTMPNRGVAILGDKVFFGTVDARLVAVSAATGVRQWETAVATDVERYYISGAPLAYRDLVVTGVGTRGGGQGFIAAFDANTGKERWRFVVIPKPGQPGSETWAGDSAREGGGPTWLTGSYDPELDLLIWAVGNPKPDYDTAARKGDNLYTNSAVALRGSTGELVWNFQFTPADDHDWDANQIAVLADHKTGGGLQKHVLWANRNGFYYVLDRVSGKYLSATPFVQETWTEGIDATGRPKPPANATRNREGFLLYPGNTGGTNWWSPSYDPALDLIFVPVLEQGMVYFASAVSTPKAMGGKPFYTGIRALKASSGEMAWEYRREPRLEYNKVGGVLSTKAGIVFGGDDTMFFALDSHNGRPLWSVETGGKINAAPVTYGANGEQFVVIAAGRNLLTFALPKSRPRNTPIR